MTRTTPPPQDRSDHGAHSPESGLVLDLFGALVTLQVRSAETNGAYAILEMVLPVDDAPLRMHLHAAAETFQILDGEFEFHSMRHGHPVTFQATAADIVHMPPNVPHGFRNISDTPSTCQVVIAPGSMEGYFLELGTATTKGLPPSTASMTQQDMRHLIEVGRKYGISFFESD